jgi:hypothetical protein
VILLLVGTAGYSIIEGWSPLESLYMTVITLATIGYGEIKPLSAGGRIFTIFIIVFGVGNVAYLVGQLSKTMVEGSLQRIMGRRKLEHQIKKIKGALRALRVRPDRPVDRPGNNGPAPPRGGGGKSIRMSWISLNGTGCCM